MTQIHVPISAADLARAEAFADAMIAAKPDEHRVEFYSAADRRAYEIAGKLGEVVAARMWGWSVDWSVHAGGDGLADFTLDNGRTVDVKAVQVTRTLDYNFAIPIAADALRADYYVQVLIAPDRTFGVITGGISRERFDALGRTWPSWRDRGPSTPIVVFRSQLSDRYPWAS